MDHYVQTEFEPFYSKKFDMIQDLEFFIEEARRFAESEMALKKDYFREELCGIKQLTLQLIKYYTSEPLNHSGNYLY